MVQRKQLITACFVAAATTVLTLALPVEARIQFAQAPAPAVKPQDTVNLTMEQRHVVKEIIIKEMKITEPSDQTAAKVPTQVGDTIPSGIALQPMPVEVSAKIPQLKAHSFVIKNESVVIVDPKDNKVAALVE